MRRQGWVLVAASLSIAGTATAQSETVRQGPPPAWGTPSAMLPVPDTTSGSLFIRHQDVQVHLSDAGQAHYLGYRVKLLDPNALQLGNVSIA